MFKNWILNLDFVQSAINNSWQDGFTKTKESIYQKAFKDARADLEETRIDDIEDRAEKLTKERMSKLLGIFDEKLVMTYDKKTGGVFVGGERLDEPRIMALKQEAEFITSTDLWKIINASLNLVTRQAMFDKSDFSNGTRDLDNGKSILYTLSFQNNVIDILRSYTQKVSKTTNNMV